MRMNRKWIALLLTGSLLTGAGGAYALTTWLPGEQEKDTNKAEQASHQAEISMDEDNLEKMTKAFQLIKGNYVEEVKDEQLVEGAIQGMLTTLDDPYSVYMTKREGRAI